MRKYNDNRLLNSAIEAFELEGIFEDVIEQVEMHAYEPGEMIVEEAEAPQYYYFLIKGKAKVMPSSEYGKLVLLDLLTPLDLLGDIEFIRDEMNYYSVMSIDKTILIALPFNTAKLKLTQNIAFNQMVSRVLAEKIRTLSIKYSRSMLYPLKSRLARHLIDHRGESGSIMVEIQMEQTADYFGITSRHLRRIMKEFEEENLLKRAKGKVVILDIDGLESYASYM